MTVLQDHNDFGDHLLFSMTEQTVAAGRWKMSVEKSAELASVELRHSLYSNMQILMFALEFLFSVLVCPAECQIFTCRIYILHCLLREIVPGLHPAAMPTYLNCPCAFCITQ